MLPGSDIRIFSDHKILIFDTLKTQHILQWQTKEEEFLLILHYTESLHNILADNLSWLYHLVIPTQITEGKKCIAPAVVSDED